MDENHFTYQFYKNTEAAWESMYQAILLAEKSIYWEIYILVDDEVGSKFIKLLADKARAGVEVKLIIDAMGSSKFSSAAEKVCKNAGVDLQKYNRMYPEFRISNWFERIIHRNHRKVLIIDEKVVFLGGVNVKSEFKTWDDWFVKITGSIARPLLRGFAKSYIASGGERKKVRHLLRPKLDELIPELRASLKYLVHSASGARMPRSKRFYLRSLAMARERVNLITPYYVPDLLFLNAITLAKKRGVEVNIFLPFKPDVRIMGLISRAYYDLTIKSGANIYVLPKMHHGKALSVDNKMGMVGSINLMPRSFRRQEESAVTFTDEKMVLDLNNLFEDLKATALPLNIDIWRKRHWLHRLREWIAKKFELFV